MLVETDFRTHEDQVRKDAGSPGLGCYPALKVGIDLVLAGLLLFLTAPLILIMAVVVRLTSRGPAFYTQTRLGRNGRVYTIYKLRSMVHDCERGTGARWCSVGDPRITPVGHFLRKWHIDELPQLWNVLRGEMSLIGPRPERPEIAQVLAEAIPHYRERLAVRPGLSGLAQVQLPPDSDLDSVRRKLAYDLYYIQGVSFWMDLRLLIGTLGYLLGVSAPVLRTLFQMPCERTVEHAYARLQVQLSPAGQLQPA